jgi:hypothetical protein
VRTLLIVSLLAASAGCKDKPKRKAPPANPSTPTAMPGGSPGQPAPDLELPFSEGGPPKKTTKPHTKADYEKLAKLEFKGFTAMVRTVGDKVFEVRQVTPGHPRFWATVTIQHCLDHRLHGMHGVRLGVESGGVMVFSLGVFGALGG